MNKGWRSNELIKKVYCDYKQILNKNNFIRYENLNLKKV